MKICFYNLLHIGDVYFSSFFIKLLCKLNENKNFYYYNINGDVFYENIPNIQRIFNKIEANYKSILSTESRPEDYLDSSKLFHHLQYNMQMMGVCYRILQIDNENILFINTWCGSEILNHTDFIIEEAFISWKKLIETLNNNFNLNIFFDINSKELFELLIKDDIYYKNYLIEEQFYSNVDFENTTFILNYQPRSTPLDLNRLNNYILSLSQNNKVMLAQFNILFENNENIKCIDKDFNIYPDPSCYNLIKIWNIAVKCKKIIIFASGSSFTFFHKLNNIKHQQLFISDFTRLDDPYHYCNRLNNNINYLIGENKNLINIVSI